MSIYLELAKESFLGALAFSIVPELRFHAMRLFGGYNMLLATGLTLLASVAASTVNYWVGRLVGVQIMRFGGGLMQARLMRGATHARTWGSLFLMASWFPILGPLLTFAIGILHVPFVQFLIITLLGKTVYFGFWGLMS